MTSPNSVITVLDPRRTSRRVYIPKPDGRQHPVDFVGFSYGFRPGRSQHHALDALAFAIMCEKVNWVLDADIREFFDTIDHGWLLKFVEHWIGDKRIVQLIQKWLAAGVPEDGIWSNTTAKKPKKVIFKRKRGEGVVSSGDRLRSIARPWRVRRRPGRAERPIQQSPDSPG